MSWWEVKNFLHLLEVAAAVVTSFLGFKEISPSSTNCGNLNWIIISWCYYWISRQEKCKRDFFCSCYADQYLHRMEALSAHGSIKKFQGSKEGMCLQQLWETSWVLWGKKAKETLWYLGERLEGQKLMGAWIESWISKLHVWILEIHGNMKGVEELKWATQVKTWFRKS